MDRERTVKNLFIVLLLLLILFFFMPGLSLALVSPLGGAFGGKVLVVIPCDEGSLVEVGPPKGGSFMWTFGTISYLFGPPVRPGQNILGMSGPFIPCTEGGIPIGGGNIILFHGTSMPFGLGF